MATTDMAALLMLDGRLTIAQQVVKLASSGLFQRLGFQGIEERLSAIANDESNILGRYWPSVGAGRDLNWKTPTAAAAREQ